MTNKKVRKVTVTFTLYEEDIKVLSRFQPEDGCDQPWLDDIRVLWEALTDGREIDGVWVEPDYESYGEFIEAIIPIWREVKQSPLERLAECAE